MNIYISDVENKIVNTSNLVTTTVLKTETIEIENKIPNNSKYITTQELNKPTAKTFCSKIEASLFGDRNWFW